MLETNLWRMVKPKNVSRGADSTDKQRGQHQGSITINHKDMITCTRLTAISLRTTKNATIQAVPLMTPDRFHSPTRSPASISPFGDQMSDVTTRADDRWARLTLLLWSQREEEWRERVKSGKMAGAIESLTFSHPASARQKGANQYARCLKRQQRLATEKRDNWKEARILREKAPEKEEMATRMEEQKNRAFRTVPGWRHFRRTTFEKTAVAGRGSDRVGAETSTVSADRAKDATAEGIRKEQMTPFIADRSDRDLLSTTCHPSRSQARTSHDNPDQHGLDGGLERDNIHRKETVDDNHQFPCAPFSDMFRLSGAMHDFCKQVRIQENTSELLEVAIRVAVAQHQTGRKFLFEHPALCVVVEHRDGFLRGWT